MSMSDEAKGWTPSPALLNAWDHTKGALELLMKTLRAEEGCEKAELTLCLRNGSRMDMYYIPSVGTTKSDRSPTEVNLNGNCSPRQNTGLNMSSEQSSELSNDTGNWKEILQCLEGYSIKQLRSFFTLVRQTLNLSAFDWPQTAKAQFLACRTGPVPSAPGRANSGKDSLLFMLNLAVQHDESWKLAVRDAINSGYTQHSENKIESERGDGFRENLERNEDFLDQLEIHEDPSTEIDANGSDWEDVEVQAPSGLLELARRLPYDDMMVSAPRRSWVTLPVLLSFVHYPRVGFNSTWFIQNTPADGNCMFSAILVAAKSLKRLPDSLDSVQKMRRFLRNELKNLSRAGRWSSRYRREWLASCLYDVENDQLQEHARRMMEQALSSYSEKDLETFLAPLRIIVSNWADMVGGEHWGGMLRAELFLLAKGCGVVIEVLQQTGNLSPENIAYQAVLEMCDTRNGDRFVALQRRDLMYPISSLLPSPEQRFLGPIGLGDTRNGWVGPFPVLRVVLSNRHYSACTSKYGFPLPSHHVTGKMSVDNNWFKHSDTLVEPFCSLSLHEKSYYEKALRLITVWREACVHSVESGRHADSLVMQARNTDLSVSMLSHLEVPYSRNEVENSEARDNFLIGDEVITCYMHLLQERAEKLRRSVDDSCNVEPPKCLYMDSWFFKSISRGLSGPSSKRKRQELTSFSVIIIPALVDGHWVLGVCYTEEGIVALYDPLGLPRPSVFNTIRSWLHAQFPVGERITWRYKQIQETRLCTQLGTVDCGIYICKAAESLGLGIPIRISQLDIPYVRKRMLMEFIRQEASAIRWPR